MYYGPTRKFSRKIRTGLSIFLLLWAVPIHACTFVLEPDATWSTNYDYINRAPVIVIGKALAQADEEYVRFEVVRVLRGQVEPQFRVAGTLYKDTKVYQGWFGACINSVYKAGVTYVLLLSGTNQDGFHVTQSPFQTEFADSRAMVRGWERLVEEFVDIQDKLPKNNHFSALQESLHRRLRPDASRIEREQARVIMRHLQTIQPSHPASHLIWLYEELATGQLPPWLMDDEYDRRTWGQILAGTPVVREKGATEFRRMILRALSMPGHPEATPLFERLMGDEATDIRDQIYAIVHLAWHDRRADAARSIAVRFWSLLAWRSDDKNIYFSLVDGAMNGHLKQGEEPAWHRDLASRNLWPNLAFQLIHHLELKDGASYDLFKDIAPYLQVSDPYAEPEKALWLVDHNYDLPYMQWARDRLQDPVNRARWQELPYQWESDEAQIPLRILIAGGDQDDEDTIFTELFCNSVESRAALIRAIAMQESVLQGLYLRLFATPELTTDERNKLILAGARIYGRNYFVDGDYLALVQGKAPDVKPLSCPSATAP